MIRGVFGRVEKRLRDKQALVVKLSVKLPPVDERREKCLWVLGPEMYMSHIKINKILEISFI